MTDLAATQSLRDRALAAWREAQRQAQVAEQERRRALAIALQHAIADALGVEVAVPVPGEGERLEVTVDGVRLSLDPRGNLVALKVCQRCGDDILSLPIQEIGDLGAFLANENFHQLHTCNPHGFGRDWE